MPESQRVTICVDAAGGDRAPDEILAGVELGLSRDPGLAVILTGPDEVVVPAAEASVNCAARPTTQSIPMDADPVSAVRSMKDSSIVVGCQLVRSGEADAFFTAGSTGAWMAASTLHIGRIPGIKRPAIATVIPTAGPPVVLLDAGANADCRPEYLVQFAHMGSAYARIVVGVDEPRVALLNIGEEPTKGSLLTREAHALMEADVPGFVGNVEGRDIPAGVADVIVTDGFTGNVALKLLEGMSRSIFREVKGVLTSSAATRLAALAVRPGLRELAGRLDPDTYGGAPLLGVDGLSFVGHGSSGRRAVASALRVCAHAVRSDLLLRVRQGTAER
jgi:glycerol-3-phosphate acyltransferase PlsX